MEHILRNGWKFVKTLLDFFQILTEMRAVLTEMRAVSDGSEKNLLEKESA